MPDSKNYEVLIIGSGGAGLTLALKLADQAINVVVLSKFALTSSSTYYAQGGISAVFDAGDSIESHIEDTLDAGAGLCDPDIVRLTVSHGKSSIEWLLQQGVNFTEEQNPSGEIHNQLEVCILATTEVHISLVCGPEPVARLGHVFMVNELAV